jgi:hypothetical protein
MSDHRKAPLVSVSAVQLLQKMMDYQKNIHADSVVKEVIGIEPTFLALFGIETLLKVDGARKVVS